LTPTLQPNINTRSDSDAIGYLGWPNISLERVLIPASISRWQLAQTRMHLSSSLVIDDHDLITPLPDRPKALVDRFRW